MGFQCLKGRLAEVQACVPASAGRYRERRRSVYSCCTASAACASEAAGSVFNSICLSASMWVYKSAICVSCTAAALRRWFAVNMCASRLRAFT